MRQKKDSSTLIGESSRYGVVVEPAAGTPPHPDDDPFHPETMPDRIIRVSEDSKDLWQFHNLSISKARQARLKEYYSEELASLRKRPFVFLDQDSKIDYLLLQNFLKKELKQLELDDEKDKKMEPLLPFAGTIVKLCEERQRMMPVDGAKAAREIFETQNQVVELKMKIKNGKLDVDKTSAFRAANTISQLRERLAEWFGFFKGYDPMFIWWVAVPYSKLDKELEDYTEVVKEELVGIQPGDEDVMVGEPIGRNGLLADLESEMIPYSPEELIEIGVKEYEWCETEMKKASHDLGCGDDWREALEHVKSLYVAPGKQPELIHQLATEAINYVKKHDLITVPRIAEENWRMFMMSPARQKVNPFFLGGESIIVSYPDDTMDYEEKMMSMRGNNVHFSRSTVFHKMIPGHHLEFHVGARHKPYRAMFGTVFKTEGWAFYWEMILWDRGFAATPENKIGMLFWRMHRCARIIFSIKFHLGLMSPQECIDLLMDMVGHERTTAEGEAGYMLGALQLYSLRQEVVGSGKMTEKMFHDRVLQQNMMPNELLRAGFQGTPLSPDFKSTWRFYDSYQ